MGDFNLDLLNYDSHLDTDDFLAMMLSNFFQPHIIQSTHFLPSGESTLIASILINCLKYECTGGNLIPLLQITYLTSFLLKNFSSQNHGQNKKQETSLSLILMIL